MKISEVCIERPVFAWVLTLVLMAMGVIGMSRLPLQHLPTIAIPTIKIESHLMGAGPEIVEAQVTRKIEEKISGIEGIDFMQSKSKDDLSEISITFTPDRSMESITNDIRDRLDKVKKDLPHEMQPPTVSKLSSDDRPVMRIALTSETVSLNELFDYAEEELKRQFESVAGVGNVEVLGGGNYIMRLYVDPDKLNSQNISTDEVLNAVRQQNFEMAAGRLFSYDRQYLVTTDANLFTPEEFDEVVIGSRTNTLVRLKDIGYSKLDADTRNKRTRLNGKPGISISIYKQSIANPIEVSRGVRAVLEKIQEQLPPDREMFTGSDQSEFIERSINEVYKTIFEATLLVIFVVFFFLKSARAAMIPLVTIPVSLVGALFFMYLLGFTLNTITLMALVLAIGLVVDDAIVVLENIYRYIEEGMPPFKAAIVGIREISFAVIAMTLTLAAVYAPIAFAPGKMGRTLMEFSITLAGAVLISGFAALTLSPMMSARLLRHKDHDQNTNTWWSRFKTKYDTEPVLKFFDTWYERNLDIALNKRVYIVIMGIALALFGALQWSLLPKVQKPKEDQGYVWVEGHAPYTSTIDYTERYVNELDDLLATVPNVKRRSTSINNPSFTGFLVLNDDRDQSSNDVVDYLRDRINRITGVYFQNVTSGFEGGNDKMLQVALRSNKTLREIGAMSSKIGSALSQSPLFGRRITHTLKQERQDFVVSVNRDKAHSLNIQPRAIATAIETLIRGKKANTFKRDNKLYDVRVEVEDEHRRTPLDILKLYMRAGDKEQGLVPMTELVNIIPKAGTTEILRYDRQRAVIMYIPLSGEASITSGIDEFKKIAKDVFADEDVTYEFIGGTKEFIRESMTIFFIFATALTFIYLVLAAQFESWRDPFIIMLTVPLSLAGAVLTLAVIKDGSGNMYSNIGMITLIGLITKHGILLVEFANEARAKGAQLMDSIRSACLVRLRPILMTTFAMVLGALPLALSTGPGSESRRQLGWVIVGGMSIGTLFTLFVLPVIYTFMSKKDIKPHAPNPA